MFLDDENATGVTGAASAPEAAKTAENESPIAPAGTPPASSSEAAAETKVSHAPQDIRVEDPVKVWADAEHKSFRVGEVVAVPEGGHAFDVELDDGSVTKVPADGLEYDDRR